MKIIAKMRVFELCRDFRPYYDSELIHRLDDLSIIMRVKRLAMLLSGLKQLQSHSIELEQYPTSGDLAARWLTDISSFGDLFEGCSVVDLGAGNGVLGLGALTLGAGKAILIDSEEEACYTAMENADLMGLTHSVKIIHATLGVDEIDFPSSDLIITNPPWGRQTSRADRPFLDAILSEKKTTHLMHSAGAGHIDSFFDLNGWESDRYGEADFPLPAVFSHHTSRRGKTRAAFWRLSPEKNIDIVPDRS